MDAIDSTVFRVSGLPWVSLVTMLFLSGCGGVSQDGGSIGGVPMPPGGG
jgi:hypothetical protein